ncbi:MAG: hypothetical protein IAG10_13905 [Planctomycetaceae bacterium]|nr:hypothetical protein [Planctomycetaceae bacterium]
MNGIFPEYTYQVVAEDPNPGDTLTYALTKAPAGADIDPDTHLVNWAPTTGGAYDFQVVVTDPQGATAKQSYRLRVNFGETANAAPSITNAPRTSTPIDRKFLFQAQATDADGDDLIFRLVDGPAGMKVDSRGQVTWVPRIDDINNPGSPHEFTIQVVDRLDGDPDQQGDTATFTLDVTRKYVNSAPEITSSPRKSAVAKHEYVYDAAGDDPDNDPFFWKLDAAPQGMTVDPVTSVVRWTPTLQQVGVQDVRLTAYDTFGAAATQSFTVTTRGVNLPPLIRSTPETLSPLGQDYVYDLNAFDPDEGVLSYLIAAGQVAGHEHLHGRRLHLG